MKSLGILISYVAVLVPYVSAHYIFQFFTYNGVEGTQYQYIRPNTNNNSPVILLNSTDLRCNEGGLLGTNTATIPVAAGQPFTFRADIAIYHAGPLSMYMAKVPSGSTAAAFDGSGQVWFKILDLGPVFDANNVATWPLSQTYTYNIPPALPNGEYLLRIQQLAIHNPYPGGIPQFYTSCAQISVSGGGSGTPGPLVSIPGFITDTDPGYVVNIYSQFYNYTVPGPAVWAGQSAGGGTGASSTSKAGSPTTLGTSTRSSSVTSTVKTSSASSSSSSKISTTSTKTSTSATSTSATSTTSAPAATSTGACTTVLLYAQCAGGSLTGCYKCASGTCTYVNDFYSQCK